MSEPTRRRLCFAIAGFLVFLSAGYIRNTRPGWNVNAQFALTVAIVEEGTLRIDSFHDSEALGTNDKVLFQGHFYSDKSPVTSFLGVPAYGLYKLGLRATGGLIDWEWARYWTTWLTMGPCAAALAWAIASLLARRGVSPERAATLAALWIAATPLLGYSILFFNYVPTCMFAAWGFLIAEPALLGRACDNCGAGVSPAPPADAVDGEKEIASPWRLLIGGVLIGLACWTLQTFAALALILTIIAVCLRPPRRWLELWPWAVGGLIGVAGYAIYSLAIFGEVTSPYRYEYLEEFREPMKQGLMGASWPRPVVAWLITFHPFRGLFVLFPVTALATAGLIRSIIAERGRRAAALAALAFLAAMLLYNSGYFMWWGGWTYAPRHLIPALPLLALGMAPFALARRRDWFIGLATIACAGAIVNLTIISLDPQPPPGFSEEKLLSPNWGMYWGRGLFGEMAQHVVDGQTDPNWGTALGFSGFVSLIPLMLIWALGLSGLRALAPRRLSEPSEAPPHKITWGELIYIIVLAILLHIEIGLLILMLRGR